MIVRLNPSALRETRWYEYLIRFALGGAITVIAGYIAARFGPIVGGLFLAFPAIFQCDTDREACARTQREGRSGRKKARQGGGCAGCSGRNARKFWTGSFRPRHLVDD